MSSMDVDQHIDIRPPTPNPAPNESLAKTDERPLLMVTIDDAHPFDLETYVSGYSDRAAIIRLLYILECCPSLARPAFDAAVQRIKTGRDVSFYNNAVNLYNQTLPDGADREEVDAQWVESTQASNMHERNKLEVELKTYQSNMIKESIRMAHRDLGNFYKAAGDEGLALKHYSRSREFCSSSQHVLEMCLSILELVIEQRNYGHITTYVFKAEAALDSIRTSDPSSPGGQSEKLVHKKARPSAERERVQSKLDVANALAYLGAGQYEKAATTFLKLGHPKNLEDWIGKTITPSDIAVYGTLCALATLSRGAITAQVIQNDVFAVYLEQEPYVRDLVSAYMGSKFKTVLDLLERYSSRHYLDIHLGPHLNELTNLIRDRALILYFQPFANVRLQKMATAFGMELNDIENTLVILIRRGAIKGRIDKRNKILKTNVVNQRDALFARAAHAAKEIQARNRLLLLRMRLQQADLIVKAPKIQNTAANSSINDAPVDFS
ncbi:G pathway suppressor 1 [Pyrrhoderma noxium]|uniref:G pathway suppressor 1 n=1 Tax=Pyrrhoderma noxium TaxID=2282107 RepID=A0A286UF56_9AGAM|nr:G pathway suppressor 1 [Pyrrhoderma noxium]